MKPSASRCLHLLRDRDQVTTHDFVVEGCGSRFGVLISEPDTTVMVAMPAPKLAVVRSGQTWLWVATSDRGEWCGHWHTHMRRAAQCARSQERYFRMRYGEGQNWIVSQVKVPLTAMVERAQAG